MAPSPLTPISEESLPNFAEIKIRRESNNNNNQSAGNGLKRPEDRGCLFFYDTPEIKGPFFDDDFFKSSHKSYDEAMQSELSRITDDGSFVTRPLDHNNMMNTYKSMREVDCKKENTRASGLTENEDNYQIALDVHNYAPSEITVKAVGDQELLLEGHHVEQTTNEGSGNMSNGVSRSFNRRFCLPGLVKLDAVTSALSSDGVLTVTAPKMHQQNGTSVPAKPHHNNNNNNINVAVDAAREQNQSLSNTSMQQQQKQNTNVVNNSSKQNTVNSSSVNGIQNSAFDEKDNRYNEELGQLLNDMSMDSKMKYQHGNNLNNTSLGSNTRMDEANSEMVEEELHYKITLDTTGYGPKDVSVKSVGDRELQIEGRHVETNSAGAETSQSFSRRFCLPGPINIDAITSSLSPKGILTVRAPKTVQEQSNTQRLPSNQQMHQRDNLLGNNANNSSTFSSNVSNSSSQHNGNHLDDFFSKDFDISNDMNFMKQNSFMEKARKDYKDSLDNMMNRNWVMNTSSPQFFSDQPLLPSTMEPTSQQSSSDIIESANDYKMKLDVSKYRPDDISVKAVGERELLIEGHHTEKPAGGPSVSHSFSRRFSLPGPVSLDAVTSSLSSNGVLTVTAPKIITS